MSSFFGTGLDALGLVDLNGSYRKPDVTLQFSERESPGTTGSHLLLGGTRPQTFQLMMRLRGTNSSKSAAQSTLLSNDQTIGDLIGQTGTFVDPDNTTFNNVTLLGRALSRGVRYHNESSTVVASQDIVLVFKRTLTDP
jgi:hypothetical protein